MAVVLFDAADHGKVALLPELRFQADRMIRLRSEKTVGALQFKLHE
jgi:hypothetical protein